MNILWQIIIGGVIGWLASILMGTNSQQGILLNIVIGIVGSWLAGHFLAPMFGIVATDWVGAILLGVAGAAVLILILKLLRVMR